MLIIWTDEVPEHDVHLYQTAEFILAVLFHRFKILFHYRTVLNQQSEKLQAYLETCHRITQQAEDAGGYEQLLDPDMFEETLSQLHRRLSGLRKLPRLSLEKTPQQSFDEPPVDCYDERDSLASDEVSLNILLAIVPMTDSFRWSISFMVMDKISFFQIYLCK